MRMPRVRFAVRWQMVAVAVVALVMGTELTRRRWTHRQRMARHYAAAEQSYRDQAKEIAAEIGRGRQDLDLALERHGAQPEPGPPAPRFGGSPGNAPRPRGRPCRAAARGAARTALEGHGVTPPLVKNCTLRPFTPMRNSLSRAKPGTSMAIAPSTFQTPMIVRKYRVSENMHDARVG
jgi:hypothetical protein